LPLQLSTSHCLPPQLKGKDMPRQLTNDVYRLANKENLSSKAQELPDLQEQPLFSQKNSPKRTARKGDFQLRDIIKRKLLTNAKDREVVIPDRLPQVQER
jgi:hypothetical protein